MPCLTAIHVPHTPSSVIGLWVFDSFVLEGAIGVAIGLPDLSSPPDAHVGILYLRLSTKAQQAAGQNIIEQKRIMLENDEERCGSVREIVHQILRNGSIIIANACMVHESQTLMCTLTLYQ